MNPGEHGSIPIAGLLSELGVEAERLWSALTPDPAGPAKRVLFVAPQRRAGTTLLAALCAYDLAQNLRKRTVLVEANLRRPALAEYAALSDTLGFSDYLDGRVSLETALKVLPPPSQLLALPGGTPRAAIPGELNGELAQRAFGELREGCDLLVIDSPPLEDGPEARLLCQYADAAVIVVRARDTDAKKSRETVAMLESARIPILGAILNRFRPELRLPFGLGSI